MIVGGRSDGHSAISDCWIHDLTTMKWKKVAHVYVYVSDIIYVVFGLQLQVRADGLVQHNKIVTVLWVHDV